MTIEITRPLMTLTDTGGAVIAAAQSACECLVSAENAGAGIYTLSRPEIDFTVMGGVVALVPATDPPPVVIPPPATGSLIEDQAQTMQPGEWRNLRHLTTWPDKDTGRSFKSFQVVYRPDGTAITDGMGWTQDIAYHNGKLIMLLMRSNYPDLMVMEPDGRFWKTMQVPGVFGGGRRPFNRLAWDDTYLYYFPGNISASLIGMAVRTPLANPGVFEEILPGFGYSRQSTNGSCAFTYVPEWGRFYSFAQEGTIRSIALGESQWTLHGYAPKDEYGVQASGYAGAIVHNPIKNELVAFGGQYFGTNPPCDHKAVVMRDPFGQIEALPDLKDDKGNLLHFRANMGKLFIDPRDGAYLMQSVGPEMIIYRNNDWSKPWTLYEDMLAAGRPLSNWETYAPLHLVPGTDVYVFLSNINGLLLHRLKDLP